MRTSRRFVRFVDVCPEIVILRPPDYPSVDMWIVCCWKCLCFGSCLFGQKAKVAAVFTRSCCGIGQAGEVWNRFLNFEYTFGGDGSLLDSSEKRWAESKHMEARRAELPCLLHRESRTDLSDFVYSPRPIQD